MAQSLPSDGTRVGLQPSSLVERDRRCLPQGSGRLVSRVPPEYRRLVRQQTDEEESPDTIVEDDEEEEEPDPYREANVESARLQLEELYRKHNPGKIADIPRLLLKYAGKEAKLIKKVQEKYSK